MKRYSSPYSLICCVVLALAVLMPAGSLHNQGWAQDREPAAERKDLGPAGDILIPTLNFPETELSTVIRSLAKISGLNILAGKDVEGTVSCYFENVTVRDALDSILSTNGYGYIVTGNVVQVRPAKDLGEDRVETVTQVFILQYLDAEEVEESLSQAFGSSGGGAAAGAGATLGKRISSNVGANAIIVTDIPSNVSEIARVLARIDRRLKQVMIEAHLVEVGYDFERKIGIDWSVFDVDDPFDRVDVNLGNTVLPSEGMYTEALHYQFGLVQDDFSLEAFFQFTEDHNDIRVLANPRILALHNRTAVIRIVDDLPYVESVVSQGVVTQSVLYKETGITLEVTPRINDEGMIIMRVVPSQKIPGPTIFLQGSTAFPVDERSAETELILADGNTAVIGGLRRQDMEKVVRQVPLLGDIPLLGLLFKRHQNILRESDLLLFITPHIIKEDTELTAHEQERLGKFDYVTEHAEKRMGRIEEKEAKARLK